MLINCYIEKLYILLLINLANWLSKDFVILLNTKKLGEIQNSNNRQKINIDFDCFDSNSIYCNSYDCLASIRQCTTLNRNLCASLSWPKSRRRRTETRSHNVVGQTSTSATSSNIHRTCNTLHQFQLNRNKTGQYS